MTMKTMIISEFKAKCIDVMKRAQREHESIVVTRRGHPIARIEPIYDDLPPRRLGTLRNRMQIKGDIVTADFDSDWEPDR